MRNWIQNINLIEYELISYHDDLFAQFEFSTLFDQMER